MKKYIYINTAMYRGNGIPLYKVFDTETRETTWVVYAYDKRYRGTGLIVQEFHSKSSAVAWREVIGSRK